MNFTKKPKEGECHANRCKKPPEFMFDASWVGGEEGEAVELCLDHAAKAQEEYEIDEEAFIPLDEEEQEANEVDAEEDDAPQWPHSPMRMAYADLDKNDKGQILNLSVNHGLDPSAISIKMGVGVSIVKKYLKEFGDEEDDGVSDESYKLAKDAEKEADDNLAEIEDIEIEGQEDLDFVAEIIAEVKGRWKRLDDEEKKITRPLRQGITAARDLFREPKKKFKQIEGELKQKVTAFHLAEKERNAAAMQEAAQAETPAERKAAIKKMGTTANVDGLTVRQVWKFQVEEPEVVPRAFLMIDEKAIKAHMKESTGEEPDTIPGIRFYLDAQVSSRSK